MAGRDRGPLRVLRHHHRLHQGVELHPGPPLGRLLPDPADRGVQPGRLPADLVALTVWQGSAQHRQRRRPESARGPAREEGAHRRDPVVRAGMGDLLPVEETPQKLRRLRQSGPCEQMEDRTLSPRPHTGSWGHWVVRLQCDHVARGWNPGPSPSHHRRCSASRTRCSASRTLGGNAGLLGRDPTGRCPARRLPRPASWALLLTYPVLAGLLLI